MVCGVVQFSKCGGAMVATMMNDGVGGDSGLVVVVVVLMVVV
jgi:hypothetical protein